MDSVAGRRKRGVSFGPAKAKEMLHNPPHGQALTDKQRGLFGLVAGGGTPTRMKSKRRKRRGKY